MKTIAIIAVIVTFLFLLQSHFAFGMNENVPVNTQKEITLSSLMFSAPSTPAEATFDESSTVCNFMSMAPCTPSEATFEESISSEMDLNWVRPAVPAVADFNDTEDTLAQYTVSTAPVTPAEADFPEIN